MSLAILPSAPMAYNQSSGPTLLAPSPSPAKRPKLSLNTANVPSVFGKGSTSLRLDTLSATSPTTRNTFSNAYDQAQSRQTVNARPSKPRLAPLATDVANVDDQIAQVDCEDRNDSAASSSSTCSTASTVDFSTAEVPYRVPYNVKSILVNSPIARKPARIISFAQSKPMFPAAKKVAFKAPLTEDIQTTKYTMKHSDIESSTSTISTLELSPSEKTSTVDEDDEDDEDEKSETVEVEKKEASSPHTGDKRESSDEEDDSDSCPATPVAGRKKRHRDWRWTLDPIGPSQDQQQQQREETDNVDQQSSGV
ncbi:hypothetical protein M409DRAFT_20216 [Zasmidium cellare ATCC 36951]|uniref:Uncharacterized protein n=1 Tax=Zasmidium cellare ATCC 36951 TaxID=1080233 RepID=A0A6A6CRT7_ZASCE|nr:uncharacterized protein M409DRAFT_20216 [Zasmidium cellare ATCC 36951]KAF2169801.1 hypothetical protein M409DRAFT_20216 [Zasmidium cellare ATCC 36951]